jgi:alpha-tubulin suppressor-like RCC1 family protein
MPISVGTTASGHNINALWTWGAAAQGRLGNNTTTPDVSTPAQIQTDTDWEMLATANSAAIAGLSVGIRNGKLYTWGGNALFRTGQGTSVGNTLVPTRIGTDSDWTWVGCGNAYGLAIRAGRLYTWGSNQSFQTGQGTSSGQTNTPTQVGSDTDWARCIGGSNVGYAIKTNGTLYAWGANADYQTAQGTNTGSTSTPAQVGSDTDWQYAMNGVESTVWSAVGLKGGRPVSWGSNSAGATGQGTTSGTTTSPTALSGYSSATDWTYIAIGSSSGGGVGGGNLYTWGNNADYRTGRNTNTGNSSTAVQVGSDTDWTVNRQANIHGSALRGNKLYMWGSNSNGRTGQATTSGNTNTPTQVGTAADWKILGSFHVNAAAVMAVKG